MYKLTKTKFKKKCKEIKPKLKRLEMKSYKKGKQINRDLRKVTSLRDLDIGV